MIRAVLDANVLVSGFAFRGGLSDHLLRLWQAGRYQLVVSEHMLNEVEHAWTKRYFRARYPPEQRVQALTLLRSEADIVRLSVLVQGIAGHAHDDLVLATAVSGRAGHLVTGDKQFLALGAYGEVAILGPRAFLDLLTGTIQ